MAGDVPVRSPSTPRRVIPRGRLERTESLYLAGVSNHRLCEMLTKEFGVSLRQARRYLLIVRERFAKVPGPPIEAIRDRCEAMLLRAFEVAESKRGPMGNPNPDAGAMATAAWRIAELHGATAAKKVDMTSGGKPLRALSDDELAAHVAALEASVKG